MVHMSCTLPVGTHIYSIVDDDAWCNFDSNSRLTCMNWCSGLGNLGIGTSRFHKCSGYYRRLCLHTDKSPGEIASGSGQHICQLGPFQPPEAP